MKNVIILILILMLTLPCFAAETLLEQPEATSAETTDVLLIVDDPAGTPISKYITLANLLKGWVGSTAITTLGTIATGVWNGTVIAVTYGGTGASTLTDGGILLGSGTGAITALGAAANGQIPIGDGTTDPVLANITGKANEITVTNGAGTIALELPDSITVNLTGAVTGNADTATTAGIATHVTITDNEDTAENNPIVFVEAGDLDGGNLGLESDGTAYYTPSTGKITATGFVGALTGNADTVTTNANLTGDVTSTGNATDITESVLGVGGTDTIFPADPDADRFLMWDDDPGALVFQTIAGGGDMLASTYDVSSDGFVDGNDVAYSAAWNGDVNAPSMNAVYDKIETLSGTGDLLADGTVPLTASWDVGAYSITALTFTSDQATGTAPFTVASTTEVANLNAATAGTAGVATTVTITDNESTAENNPIVFVAGGDLDGGNLGLETDGTTFYTPSTGTITATEFVGGGAGLTGVTSSAAWDDIGDPDNNGLTTIDFDNAAESILFTTAYDTAGTFFTIRNSDAALTNEQYFLDLDYSVADSDGQGHFIKCQDAGGIVFDVRHDGDTTIWGTLTIAAGQQIMSTDDLVFVCDNNGDGTNVFSFQDATLTEIAQISETGAMQLDGDITVSGGEVVLGSTTQDGTLVIHDDDVGGDATVTIQAVDALVTGYTLTLPPNDGGAGEVLTTDGSGVLTFTAAGAGDMTKAVYDAADSGGVTKITTADSAGATNYVVFTATAVGTDEPETDAALTYAADTGTLAATQFSGGGAGLTGVVAATGDSATSFFSSGEIADAQISDTLTSSTCTGTAAVATTVTLTDDDATNDDHDIVFTTDAAGAVNLEADIGDLKYNPSTGLLTTPTLAVTTATVTNNIKSEPKHLIFTIIDPLATQTETSTICIWPAVPAALTVTKIQVTLDAAANEVAGDLKWADAFIGLGTATVINVFDTASGVLVDDSITAGAVASGKCLYLSFDSAPNTAIHQMCVDITYDFD